MFLIVLTLLIRIALTFLGFLKGDLDLSSLSFSWELMTLSNFFSGVNEPPRTLLSLGGEAFNLGNTLEVIVFGSMNCCLGLGRGSFCMLWFMVFDFFMGS